jgi:transcriptional regulator with XRE-family HTH domain
MSYSATAGGCVVHKLYKMRVSVGLTRRELAELSGVAESTIRKIEEGSRLGKTNYTTASLLEAALYMPGGIFHPSEICNEGRPAATGTPFMRAKDSQARYETVCPCCHLVVPNKPQCEYCDCDIETHHLFDQIVASLAM